MATSPENWARIKDLFEAALERGPEHRSRYLQENASGHGVREEVERLLAEHEQAGSFLSSPAFEVRQLKPNQSEHRFLPGAILAGRFRIVRFIAAGGMGEVYEAQDLELRESLAIKTIKPEILQQSNALARFKREIHLARKVTHPNVCRVFDLFRHVPDDNEADREATFVSMELLQGETLSQRIRHSGSIAPDQALPLIEQIAAGLTAAHHVEVVHHDLKPSNVVLVPDGDSGQIRAVITDFGLACRSSGNLSLSTDLAPSQGVFGTPAYMAPEQIEGHEVTSAADIYALGLVIYEMVTGALPFGSETPLSMVVRRVHEPAPSPRLLLPSLDTAWESAILRCLERTPGKRFQAAEEVVLALSGETRSRAGQPATISRRKILIPSLAALLAMGAAIGFYASRHRNSEGSGKSKKGGPAISVVTPRPTVAVLGFKNLAGRPDKAYLSNTFAEELTTEISAGQKLRTIPGENVTQMKINLSLPDEESYGSETLSKIRQNIGSDYVVLGSYLAQGNGQVRLDLRIEDAANGRLIDSISIRGNEIPVDDLVSRAGVEVRAMLGVGSLTPVEVAGVKASQPSNPEAVRLYSEGLIKLRRFDAPSARDLLQSAVAADPDFALAHSALAQAWGALGYDQKAREQAKKAFELSATLSTEDRHWIEGGYREMTYEWDKAADVYAALMSSAPDNIEYGLRLAKVQTSAGRGKEALATVAIMRQLPVPSRDDPRIDLVEANAAGSLGDFKQAQRAAESSAMKADAHGTRLLAAEARREECWALQNLDDFSQATTVCETAKKTFESTGDFNGVARVLSVLGNKLDEEGDIDGSKRMFGEALVEFHKTGNRSSEAWTLNNIGNLNREQGHYAEAIKLHEEAVTIFLETENKGAIGTSYTNLAINFEEQGKLLESRTFFEKALSIQRDVGDKRRISLIQNNLALLLFNLGDLAGSKAAAEEALATALQIGNKSFASQARSHIAAVLWAQDHLDSIRQSVEQELRIDDDLGRKGRRAEMQQMLAQLSLDEGKPAEAEALAREAIDEFHRESRMDREVSSRALIAESLLAQDKKDDARKEIEQALLVSANNKARNVDLAIAAARLDSSTNCASEGRRNLQLYLSEANKQGAVYSQFDVWLALGEFEMKCGRATLGRKHLATLEKDATEKGFLLFARKAAAASK
jgi:serine/threonine protein kinase/tetratricopeptide (TPR) repeat protein